MKIFVGNLHPNASENELHTLFNDFGRVLSVTAALDDKGKSQGFGYVDMELDIDGHTAIKQLNRINFMNQFLDVFEMKNKIG